MTETPPLPLPRFLRCAPFDEFKLWKYQVDNGSKRGGERLNILTRSLLLRRTKHQTDSSGKPLVQPAHFTARRSTAFTARRSTAFTARRSTPVYS